MKKVIMIGPVFPYKGGISHYTSLMYHALSKKYNMHMVSYELQYPHFLFKKEQKDYSNDIFKIENTDFLINTVNPFNWIHVANQIRKMNAALIIVQWWHPFFAPCYWTICRLLRHSKILFICHNVFPHERFWGDKFITKQTLKNGNHFIVHSSKDEADLKSLKISISYRKTVLPTYNIFKLHNLRKDESRQLLNISPNENILLFFGFVRKYKGLKYLLQAMPDIVESLKKIRLLVVGDFGDDKDIYIQMIKNSKIQSYVNIYDEYIPNDEVEKFFSASDLVVLPYESATQSAIIQIAYGFSKPVIATNVGGLPEVVLDDKTGYIVEACNEKKLAERIIHFFNHNKAEEFKKHIQKESYRYSWEKMADVIEELTKI